MSKSNHRYFKSCDFSVNDGTVWNLWIYCNTFIFAKIYASLYDCRQYSHIGSIFLSLNQIKDSRFKHES